ncbi:MAG: hypothetical protein NZ521_05555, partial [Flammeovirgaceae bacterium]|nr:hypothetical protein [Flammeovirgaceae bacterium]MDW8287714.1 hypothetical protein [Flammeovirgaceae bacterium]
IENPSQVRTIRGFVEQLEREGKKVNCLVFTTHREAIQELEKAQILSYQDITLWGNWKNQAVSRFMSQPFDYLFCLSMHLLPPITYILQHCKAKCRVGIYREEHQKFFELMVGTPYFSLEVLSDEILHRSRSIVSVRPQVLVEA